MTHYVYGYGQASIDPRLLSTGSQEHIACEAFASLLQTGQLPVDSVWQGFIRDDATRKPTPFRQRYRSTLLMVECMRGDHIVIAARHDCIFANVIDACEVLELTVQINFRLIVLDHGLDTGVPETSVTAIPAIVKSLKRRERQRTSEEFRYRKQIGMPAGGKTPIGWEIVRADLDGMDSAYFVPDHGARRVAQFIAEHYDRWGGNFEQTAYWMNAQKVFRPDGKRWRKSAIRNWYYAAKTGFPLPNGQRQAYPIPVGAMPVVEAHRRIEPDVDD